MQHTHMSRAPQYRGGGGGQQRAQKYRGGGAPQQQQHGLWAQCDRQAGVCSVIEGDRRPRWATVAGRLAGWLAGTVTGTIRCRPHACQRVSHQLNIRAHVPARQAGVHAMACQLWWCQPRAHPSTQTT